ncbi:MAG: YigZ family protein [Bacteroidales bacterium]|nr:YigZ family protein [Bacteroidales bacterium]
MHKYLTILSESTGIFKDRKSKFIAITKFIKNEKDAKQELMSIKTAYADANHHCYAYRYLNEQLQIVEHWSDDGEPSNSAGIQIYYVLKKYDLLNVMIVVVRYFGGVKLGVPGLINAYKLASIEAVQNAHMVEKTITKVVNIAFSYESLSKIMNILKKYHCNILKQVLDIDCAIDFEVELSYYKQIETELKNICKVWNESL